MRARRSARPGAPRPRRLRAGLAACALVCMVGACGVRAPAAADAVQAPPPARLEAIADAAMAQGRAPGMALMEIRDGAPLPEVVRGLRAAGGDERVEPGDAWHLGSNAKPMTAALVARLVEQGRLSWTAPLEELLPMLAGGMRPEYREATLVDLLSHRSGLPENTDVAFVETFYARDDSLAAQRLDYIARALRDPPAVPRGRFNYSNTGFLVAAAAAEHATGLAYETLMRREVFAPLGMTGAAFGPTRPGQPLGHEGGRPLSGPRADNPPMFSPAGGIAMPLADWARFVIDQTRGAHGRGRLLSREGYALLQTPVAGDDERRNGLDWGVREQPFGTLLMHSGSNGYWFALVAFSPDADRGVLVAANAAEDAGADAVVSHALRQVVRGWAPARPS